LAHNKTIFSVLERCYGCPEIKADDSTYRPKVAVGNAENVKDLPTQEPHKKQAFFIPNDRGLYEDFFEGDGTDTALNDDRLIA